MHFFQWDTFFTGWQVGSRRVQTVGDAFGIQLQQSIGIAFQVEHDDPVIKARMPAQWNDRRRAQAAGWVALRDMQQWSHAHAVHQAGGKLLVA